MSRANARIYRETARRIAECEGIFSCNELARVSDYNYEICENYQNLFDLGEGSNANCIELWQADDEVNRRVLMLCLAAAIEFDGRK
jgi:hypothetical protein